MRLRVPRLSGVRVGAVALLLVLGAAATACGDDDDAGSAAANGAFVAEYERVTAAFEERTEAIRQQGQAALASGDTAVLAVYEDLLAASREAHDAYTAIDPAPDVRAAFENLVAQLDLQADVLSAVVEAAQATDDAAVAAQLQELATIVVEVTNARRTVDRQLEELGGISTEE